MFSQPSKALHSMALEYGVRLLSHNSWAFADGQTQRHSRCTVTLPPEECQCGKAAGGCSSRPAFFKEKIFDFLQYTMSFQLEQPPVEDSSVKTAAFLLWSSNLRRKSIFFIPAVHEQTRQRGSRGRLHDMMGVGYRDAAPYMSCLCNRLLLQDFTFY